MSILQMKAIFDCEADRHGELSFKEGDILVDIVKSAENGWFEGRLENSSERGLFPFNYVEKLSCTSNTQPRCFAIEDQDTEKSKSFDHVSDQFKVDLQKRNASSLQSPSSSEENMTMEWSNNILSTVSLPRVSLRKAEEKPKPGIKQDITSISQNYCTPSLLDIKHTKIDREVIATPIQQSRGKEATNHDSSRQLVGIHHVKLVPSNDNQLLKPSQLKNKIGNNNALGRKLEPSPKTQPPLSPRITGTARNQPPLLAETSEKLSSINITEKIISDKFMMPDSKNPAPPLPLRPRSVASRKSHTNKNNSTSDKIEGIMKSTPVVTTVSPNIKNQETWKEKKRQINSPINKLAIPAIKPKPNSLKPALPPRSNSSQTSRTVQLECKTSLDHTKSNNALVTRKTCQPPPTIPDKPSISIVSMTKPLPPPKPEKSSRTKINCQSPANEKNGHTNPAPVGSKLSTNKEITLDVPDENSYPLLNKRGSKKEPPPPPPSRPTRVQRHEPVVTTVAARARYAILFETIQDKGYVDEDVAQAIWRKYKLSKEEVDAIWKECGSENPKLLDKDAFINSMYMIDTMVSKQEHAV